MLEIIIQEPDQNPSLTTQSTFVETSEAVPYTTSTEMNSNPRVYEEIGPTEVLVIGGLAVFGIAGMAWNTRTRRRADSAK